MISTFTIDENAPILVEFELQPGAYDVSLSSKEMAQKATEALDQAMNTIHNVARRVTATITSLPQPLTQVEVDFGIVLNMEVGAMIAKTGTSASLNIKLIFEKEEIKLEQSKI
jgi:Trypsin-co-occurring domain 1